MADTLAPISPSASTTDIIDTINSNFRVLALRIKSLNQNFSYLDMMRIADVFTSDSNVSNTILTQFISTSWASLDNYAGVYIRLTNSHSPSFFLDENTEVHNGDYVVKLPGNQFLHIEGEAPIIYVPTYDTSTPFNVTYKIGSSSEAYTTPINFPTNTSSTMVVHHQENIHFTESLKKTDGTTVLTDAAVRDVRWYDHTTKEEVVWSKHYVPMLNRDVPASYASVTNPTTLTLDATFIYDNAA